MEAHKQWKQHERIEDMHCEAEAVRVRVMMMMMINLICYPVAV